MIPRNAIARALGQLSSAAPRQHAIIFGGGWDTVTPALEQGPGFCQTARNYECDINGGYVRVKGYERHDGRPSPSEQSYALMSINLTGAISVGDTVTGVTSAATAIVIATASGYIVIAKIAGGTFTVGETLNVGGVGQATVSAAAITGGGATADLRAQYKNLAADEYRADIAAPTGSGGSLGGVRYKGVTYTWRNNAGGTAADMWKSTATGWQQITLYNEVSFTAGAVTTPADGETLTQGGVTATVKRVVTQNQTTAWAGTATGRFIITNPAGGNFAAGAATLSGGATCTLSGVQTAITLLPGGRFRCVEHNFTGATDASRVYACDGVNRGFEFDGDVLVPIDTGMSNDVPNEVYEHLEHLFFGFLGSVQHASPGFPYIWSVIVGAGELAMGDTVTGFSSQPGSTSVGALVIFTRNRLSILYGTGVSNWQLIQYRKEIGAYARSIQDVGYTMFLDDQGITNILASQAFGNFSHNALSARIKTWLNTQRTKVTDSCVSRNKSQYRLFFSDQYALFATFSGNKLIGMMPIYFLHPVSWVHSSEDPDGSEVIFFGSTNGMVYQMEMGTSFDGDAIEHYLKLAWDFVGSPRVAKAFLDAALEVNGSSYAAFDFGFRLGYGESSIAQLTAQTIETSMSAAIWGSFVWGAFTWGGQTLLPSVADMGSAEGENISLSVRGYSDYHESIRFSGAIISYVPRRRLRP